MADEVATTEVVKPTETPAGDAVNTQQPSTDVKPEPVVIAQPTVEMVKYGNYEIAKPVFEEVKKNSYHEGWRKAEKEFAEKGLLVSQEQLDRWKQAENVVEVFGEAVTNGKKLTPEEALEFLAKEKNSAQLEVKKQVDTVQKEMATRDEKHAKYVEKVRSEKKMDAIRQALIDNEHIKPSMVNDAASLIAMTGVITIDRETEVPLIIDPKTGEKKFTTSGDLVSVKEYCTEWLMKKPDYLQTVGKDGAGGNYQQPGSKENEENIPPHLRGNAGLPYTKGDSRIVGTHK